MSKLRQIRKAAGLTTLQVDGIDQTTLSRIERFNAPPKLEHQITLARAYGLSLHELQRQCDWPVTDIPGMAEVSNG